MEIGLVNDWSSSKAPAGKQPASAVVTQERADVSTIAAQAESAASASPERLQEAVSSIQEFAQSVKRDINFSLDDSSGRVVVKVTDNRSGDVIRQIPSEEALKLAESLSETRSLLFTAQV